MASTTPILYRDLIFYQIFVRQFSKEHNFKGVIKKLDELKKRQIDVIQLLPIHPIGVDHRKGSVGSPYSIKDYYAIDNEYGTIDDFKLFISECHKRDILVVMDIVFNHTSHDSNYSITHPEWFYHKEDGTFCNRVGDWWDIIDFNFENNQPLKDELTNVLCYWSAMGVDGYRCDVAPLIPMDFWRQAKKAVLKINPNTIFISESVHLGFIKYLRDLGYDAYSDSEILQVFDICYDYDIYDDLTHYLRNEKPLSNWTDGLIRQESTYPKNYVKLRYLENHDMDRILKSCVNNRTLYNLTAMLYFLKGAPFIYNGQECSLKEKPNLFEYDEINWLKQDNTLIEIMTKMGKLRKDYHFINGVMKIEEPYKNILTFTYTLKDVEIIGHFNLNNNDNNELYEFDLEGYDYLNNGEYKKNSLTNLEMPLIIIVNK